MSGPGTRPTRGLLDTDGNRQALAQALLGLPARVGQSFQNMANAGLQANEAFLQGRGTDGEDMLARPFLPGADTGGRLGALASFVGSNMAMGGPAGSLGAGPSMPSKGIRAYHGSPHDFDRFDLSKIGTGEGAQAYGHGLYFAENEGVARSYRDALRWQKSDWNNPEWVAGYWLDHFKGDRDAALKYLNAIPDQINRFPRQYAPDALEKNRRSVEILMGQGPNVQAPTGRLYEVNINARPEQFLDWDAPLSAQSPQVRDAINRVGRAPETAIERVPDDMRGALYRDLVDKPDAVKALQQHGVAGIRYLDQGSRAAGDGSRNYVVFDDKLIDILRKYGLAGLTAGGVGMAAGGDARANPLAAALLGGEQK